MIKLTFYLFSLILVAASVRVITAKNPVHSALFLVLAFFSSAAIWLLLQAEFLAIVLILVYVGAVMVLFLFVLMMLDINIAPLREGFVRYLPLAAFVGAVILFEMILVLGAWQHVPSEMIAASSNVANTEALGLVLYTDYLYPFEIAAVILLVAMIAAIVLTMRPHTRAKYQKPEQQVVVKRNDRVKLVEGMTVEQEGTIKEK